MPKVDCKYWDKCYQRNEDHLQKYNHPPKAEEKEAEAASETDAQKEANAETKETETAKVAPKRKSSEDTRSMEKQETEDQKQNDTGEFETETADLHREALNNIAGKNYMEIMEKRIRFSVQQEYDNLCETNEFIRHKFLVEMPPDFYDFWKFINSLKAEPLKHLETVFQLHLVGPFEFLAGKFHKAKIGEPGDYLRHWRFYYDPPEFQTVFVKRDSGIHYGYWRDVPQDKANLMLARNDTTKGCEFHFVAGNIFEAFLYYLQHDFLGTPFTAAQVTSTKKALEKFKSDNSLDLAPLERLQQERNRRIVAKTFHRAGIVVPFDKRTQQGYRPLMVSDAELKKILDMFEHSEDIDSGKAKQVVLEKLQPVANAATIAVDECDFGSALELGIDLFASGHKELHMLASSLLVPAYSLLSRPQFIAIAKAHMESRNRGLKLSMFDILK